MKPVVFLFALLTTLAFAHAAEAGAAMVPFVVPDSSAEQITVPFAAQASTASVDSMVTEPAEPAMAPDSAVVQPADPDSLKYYEVEAFKYRQEQKHKHAVSKVLTWVAVGVGVAGMGTLAAGFMLEDEDQGKICRGVGGGILLGALVTMGFSFGFDLSAEGLRVKAHYYDQKLADYKRRHSALNPE